MVNNTSPPVLKPFVKWAGGKRQLLAEIKKYIPHNINDYTYYEPFAGAGALLFELQPKKALINDSNTQLMITYNAIKKDAEGLITLLKNHEKMNDKDYYYEIRNMDRYPARFNTLSDTEKAARFIYLNRTCYNGLYRVNSRGFFNVPFGENKNPLICNEPLLIRISLYLNSGGITILNGDFESALQGTSKDSFIYFDPPYHSPDKGGFKSYQANGFNEKEQERLRNVMLEMTKHGVKCLLSNADTAFIRKLYNYDCFEIIPVEATRAINSDYRGRGKVNELLIRNWRPAREL